MRAVIAAALLLLAGTLAVPAGAAADLAARLAAADPGRGKSVFRKCAACHTVEKGGRQRLGPTLWGIVGAPVAARPGFRYSKGLKAFGGRWTPDRLDAYLERPRAVVKGGRMNFPGLKRPRDRADLIAWLRRMSDSPGSPGPAPAPAAAPAEPAEPEDFGVMVAAPGAAETYDACTACHSERLVAQQGLTRAQWDELLDWMVEEHAMEPVAGRSRAIILDYLARHYGPDRPNFPRR